MVAKTRWTHSYGSARGTISNGLPYFDRRELLTKVNVVCYIGTWRLRHDRLSSSSETYSEVSRRMACGVGAYGDSP